MTLERTDLAALERYDQAEQVAGIGSYEYGLETGVRRFSPNLFRLYGMDPETSEPLDLEQFAKLVHPADAEPLRLMQQSLDQQGSHSTDLRIIRAGEERTLYFRVEVTADRIYGTVQDVTEVRATERRLREREQQLIEAQRVAGIGSFEIRYDTEETVWSDQLYRLFGRHPGEPPWTLRQLAERMQPPMPPEQIMAEPPSGHYTYTADIERADGAVRRYEFIGEIFRRDGSTYSRGTVRDVTERQRGEARQAAVAALSRRALAGLALPELFEVASEWVAEATAAESSAVLTVEADDTVWMTAAHGVAAELVGTQAPDVAAAMAHEAIGEDRPVIVADWPAERSNQRPVVASTEMLSSIAVPIRTSEGPFGILGASSLAPGRFGPESVDFMVAMANVLAAAIERRSQEEAIRLLSAQRGRLVAQTVEVEERVRRRVSEAIHDGALQNLLASRQDLVEAGEVGGPAQRELLERGRRGIETAVEELREAVQALHPVVLQHAGLEAALGAAADHAARGGAFEHHVRVEPGAAGVRDELVLSLARELLANAAKHAEASRVEVEVAVSGDHLELTVSDDGRGIPLGRVRDAPRRGHIGLASLTERVEAIGGSLEIAAAGRSGASVTARMPLPGVG